LKDAKDKYEDLEVLRNSKLKLENCYDVMREAADAVLLKEGYKSYSHEASIVFLYENNIIEKREMHQFNRFRNLRNKSKYEAMDIDENDSKSCSALVKVILRKIERFLNNN